VYIRGLAFVPKRLVIHVGQHVRFINDDSDAHTATAKDKSFDSGGLDTGESWEHAFTTPGTIAYLCALRPAPLHDRNDRRFEGEDVTKRRSFLDHLAWTGSGVVWTLGASGTLVATADAAPGFSFVQFSERSGKWNGHRRSSGARARQCIPCSHVPITKQQFARLKSRTRYKKP